MDRTEFDLNNLPLSSIKPNSLPDDYDKDLQLAAEFGRYLLERNEELQNYISVLQKEMDEKQVDMKLLEAKVVSMREQLDEKCKQSDLLDAANYDLEQELASQRRENLQNRKQIKDLFDLCDKTRQQCYDLEQEYKSFRTKQFSSRLSSTSSMNVPRQRSHSFHLKPPLSLFSSVSSSLPTDPTVSSSIYKSHLQEFKSRIHSLENECLMLTDQLNRSEEEKNIFIERLNDLERQHRDEIDSLQNELNHCRKLLERNSSLSSSKSHQDLSLFEEVNIDRKTNHLTLYQPTDYHSLFAPLYEKLKF